MKRLLFLLVIPLVFFGGTTTIRAAVTIPLPNTGAYFGAWATDASGNFSDDQTIALEQLLNKHFALYPLGWFDSAIFFSNNLPIDRPTGPLTKLKHIDTTFHAIPMIHLNTVNRTLSEIVTNTIHPNDTRSNYQIKPDDYFRNWAQGLKAYGKPVFLRIFSEMNGSPNPVQPWRVCNGCKDPDTGQPQTPQLLVAAWRHVHDIFQQEGATNVMWMWIQIPHYSGISANTVPYDVLYPGDAYVDWVGWDVYNSRQQGKYNSFYNLLSADYIKMNQIAPGKPMIIPEFNTIIGFDSTGADKAKWFTDMLTVDISTKFPKIKALLLFNVVSDQPGSLTRTLWIQITPAATKVVPAFKNAIASSYYLSSMATPTPVPTGKPADLNGDGIVNVVDFNILVSNFRKTGSPGWIKSDIDKNGKVDIFDYSVLIANVGK